MQRPLQGAIMPLTLGSCTQESRQRTWGSQSRAGSCIFSWGHVCSPGPEPSLGPSLHPCSATGWIHTIFPVSILSSGWKKWVCYSKRVLDCVILKPKYLVSSVCLASYQPGNWRVLKTQGLSLQHVFIHMAYLAQCEAYTRPSVKHLLASKTSVMKITSFSFIH